MNIKIHGSGVNNHSNSPDLYMVLSINSSYRNYDHRYSLYIDEAYLKAGSYNFPIAVTAWLERNHDSSTSCSETLLINKPHTNGSWSDGQYRLASPVELAIFNPDEQVITLNIGVMSICTCNTPVTNNAKVYEVELTGWPDLEPYFYRKDRDGWRLTRPFYICKTINGVKGWCNCEDQTKLVFGPNGEEL